MQEFDFVCRVCGSAGGKFAGPVAGADEVGIGEGGAFYDVSEVDLPNESIFAVEFVDELDCYFGVSLAFLRGCNEP